jgi:hypothetical protein
MPLPVLRLTGDLAVFVNFTPAEHANFVAAKTVALATAFLDGRHDAAELGRSAHSLMCELVAVSDDAPARAILDPARLLVISMVGTAGAEGEARRERWRDLMGALVKLVKFESHELRRSGAQHL